MPEAYLVDAVRTPVGPRRGGLAALHQADLGTHVIGALVERTVLDAVAIEDVLFGCPDNIGAQAGAIARTLSIDDIDFGEINEAFAGVVLAWLAETGADPVRVNPNGGAVALGHPIGASGARLMTSMLHEPERTGGRFGLQTRREGDRQTNVTIIERLG